MARGRFYNINQYIRAAKVRVIDQEGKQIGVLPLAEALKKAQAAGLDLVEVAPKAEPPVCKIINFRKFIFEENKKKQAGGEVKVRRKRKKRRPDFKQVKLSLFIEEHDFERNIKRAKKFLKEGNRVRFNIFFRGRQITRKEFGYQLLEKVKLELETAGQVIQPPNLKGKLLMMTFKPKKQNENEKSSQKTI